jgi:hypothetical protein
MKLQACLLAGTLVLTPVAWAGNCPALIAQIDEILASSPDLDEETIVDEDLNKSVKQLRDEGEKLHKEGKHKESVEILERAIDLLSEETG